MKKLNKVACCSQPPPWLRRPFPGAFAQNVDNWVNSTGTVWKNGTNELCWRDANWTPATAKEGCDGAPKKAPGAPPARPPGRPRPGCSGPGRSRPAPRPPRPARR